MPVMPKIAIQTPIASGFDLVNFDNAGAILNFQTTRLLLLLLLLLFLATASDVISPMTSRHVAALLLGLFL